jgi:hypothetical protein
MFTYKWVARQIVRCFGTYKYISYVDNIQKLVKAKKGAMTHDNLLYNQDARRGKLN